MAGGSAQGQGTPFSPGGMGGYGGGMGGYGGGMGMQYPGFGGQYGIGGYGGGMGGGYGSQQAMQPNTLSMDRVQTPGDMGGYDGGYYAGSFNPRHMQGGGYSPFNPTRAQMQMRGGQMQPQTQPGFMQQAQDTRQKFEQSDAYKNFIAKQQALQQEFEGSEDFKNHQTQMQQYESDRNANFDRLRQMQSRLQGIPMGGIGSGFMY